MSKYGPELPRMGHILLKAKTIYGKYDVYTDIKDSPKYDLYEKAIGN